MTPAQHQTFRSCMAKLRMLASNDPAFRSFVVTQEEAQAVIAGISATQVLSDSGVEALKEEYAKALRLLDAISQRFPGVIDKVKEDLQIP